MASMPQNRWEKGGDGETVIILNPDNANPAILRPTPCSLLQIDGSANGSQTTHSQLFLPVSAALA